MKRYCVGHIYEKKDFCSLETRGYYDINYNNLMERLLLQTEQETTNTVSGFANTRNEDLYSLKDFFGPTQKEYDGTALFEHISFSIGCKMDILNELYLLMIAASDEEELLFLKTPLGLNVTSKSNEEELSTKDILEELNESMRITIHNKLSKNANLDHLIFDIKDLKKAKNTKIHPFGKNVKRLWLYSKNFRKIFATPQTRFDKYGMKEIRCILYDNGSGYIKYGLDDCIILEKLLGIDTRLHFDLYILNQLEDPTHVGPKSLTDTLYPALEPLIDILMECEGLYSRRLFMQDLGYHLSELKTHTLHHKLQWIEKYVEKLEKAIRLFNKNYDKTIKTYMENYTKLYTYEKAKKMIAYERRMLSYYSLPFLSQSSDYQNIIKKEVYKYITESLFRAKKSKDQISQILENWDNVGNRMHLWCENEFYYKGSSYDTFEPEELSNRIQSRIIEKSHKRYNSKTKSGSEKVCP